MKGFFLISYLKNCNEKTLLLFLAFFFVLNIHAQNTPVFEKTNGLISPKSGNMPITFIGSSKENMFVMCGTIAPTGPVRINLLKTETGLVHQYEMIKSGKEKRWPTSAFMLKDKLYIIYNAITRKAGSVTYYAYEVNTQTLEMDTASHRLFDLTYKNQFEALAAISGFQISNPPNQGIIFWLCTPQITPGNFYVEPTGAYTMHFFFLDNALNLEHSPTCDVPASAEFRQELTTPEGNLYFLFQDKVSNASENNLSPFRVLKFDATGKIKIKAVGIVGWNLVDAKFILNKKGELMLAGYCSTNENPTTNNVFSAVVDTSIMDLDHIKVLPLNLQTKSDEKIDSHLNYYLKDVLFDKADDLYIIGEGYKQDTWVSYAPVTNRYNFGNASMSITTGEKTGEEHTYIYGNIWVSCINSKNYEAKTVQIKKYQEVSEGDVSNASFIAKPDSENGIAVLYNGFVPLDEHFVNDKYRKYQILHKMVLVNSSCEKTEMYFLCGMQKCINNEVPENYECKSRIVMNNSLLMPDGSCLLLSKEIGDQKRVYIWK